MKPMKMKRTIAIAVFLSLAAVPTAALAQGAAFAAAGGPGIQAWTEAVFEPDGHSDVLFMVLHAGGQGGEE